MVTKVIQGKSEDAISLGNQFIGKGMPNGLAWGRVCQMVHGLATDGVAIRTKLSEQEEAYFAKEKAKREKESAEPTAKQTTVAEPVPATTNAAVTETAPAAASPSDAGPAKPVSEAEGPKDPKEVAVTSEPVKPNTVNPSDSL